MARKAGGFGFVMLLVVAAVVLWLAGRAGQRTIPAAPTSETQSAAGSPAALRDAAGDLPDLDAMRDATSRHAGAVRDALAATESATGSD